MMTGLDDDGVGSNDYNEGNDNDGGGVDYDENIGIMRSDYSHEV